MILRSKFIHYIVAPCLILAIPEWVKASGFTIYDHGAKEQAQGNAVVATVDTPAAVFYNPSRLAVIEGTEIEGGGTIARSVLKFHSDVTGDDVKVRSTPTIPYFFLSHKISEKTSLGAGLYASNGNSVDYPKDWEGRFLVTSSELRQVNFALSVGSQMTDRTAAGFSIALARSSIELENQIDLSPLSFPGEGTAQLTADGYGVFAVIGLHHDFGRGFSIGAVYTSPMRISYDGSADFAVPAPFTPLFPDGDVKTKIDMPQSVVLGVAWLPIEDLHIEADIQWADWNNLKDQKLEFENTTAVVRNTTIPYDLRSTYTFRLGSQYQLAERSQLRAGYVFDPGAARDSGINPILPDVDNHIFTIGYGFQHRRWRFDSFVAYNRGIPRKVDDSLSRFPDHRGTYESKTYGGGIAVSYRF